MSFLKYLGGIGNIKIKYLSSDINVKNSFKIEFEKIEAHLSQNPSSRSVSQAVYNKKFDPLVSIIKFFLNIINILMS